MGQDNHNQFDYYGVPLPAIGHDLNKPDSRQQIITFIQPHQVSSYETPPYTSSYTTVPSFSAPFIQPTVLEPFIDYSFPPAPDHYVQVYGGQMEQASFVPDYSMNNSSQQYASSSSASPASLSPETCTNTSSTTTMSASSTTKKGARKATKKRRRVASVAQRSAANVRERRRMLKMNDAFEVLRKQVPTFAYEKRLSRIETLRLAITYIEFMNDVANGSDPASVKLNKAHRIGEMQRYEQFRMQQMQGGGVMMQQPMPGGSYAMAASYSQHDEDDLMSDELSDD